MKKFFRHLCRKEITLLILFLQLITLSASAQKRINGRVTDEEGKGIPAITVAINNTTLGTITDISGNYILNSDLRPGNYILVFSGIGFKNRQQSITISNESSYTVNSSLQLDPLGLDEVIVTGTLGRTSKRQLGNAVSTINATQLQNTGTSNLSTMLNGRVMGAQVTQTPVIRVPELLSNYVASVPFLDLPSLYTLLMELLLIIVLQMLST